MFVSMIIVFREAMEAGLIVGIVLAASEGVLGRGRWIAGGMVAGVAGASLVAVLSRAVGRPRLRPLAVAGLLAAMLAGGSPARADELPTLVFRQHRFVPDRITVPAHVKFRLRVQNSDDTADEFESTDLNREKLVAPGETITVFLGPLDPGEYRFFGDFHQDTAQGVMVAK